MVAQGAEFWPLRLARELDDAILDIRLNEFDTAVIVFKSEGDPNPSSPTTNSWKPMPSAGSPAR